jgi:NAD(P)-dependent dehydrogenase (short-subunit alcohol dehydrogenase family)
MRLAGKVAVVTGSTSGIGRACAERFAEEGASVIINGFPPERGEHVADGVRAKGGSASYCRADVRQDEDLQKLIQFAVETYGRLDILMNNAACGRSAAVVEQEAQDWDEVFASTVRAAYLGSKYAIPLMIQAGGGSIIHTASVHGLLGGSRGAAYDAAKAAIINLTRQMAVDYGKHGIRVNALCPGRILTEGKVKWLESRPDEVRRQKLVYPLGRPGTLREIANAALFLASDESSFVTGHALVVDGGLTAQLQDAVAARVEEGLSSPTE